MKGKLVALVAKALALIAAHPGKSAAAIAATGVAVGSALQKRQQRRDND